MKFGLPDRTIKAIHDILSGYPEVDQAVLYGSRAKGNYKDGSDIDLTLIGGAELTLPVLHRIVTQLEDSSIPYMVDLSILEQIHDLEVKAQIQRCGVVFFEKGEMKPR